ncbi:hypothetical protein SAMN02799632_01238 [Acinetobacter pittii]|uniref:Uncharacterized protein n=1 Tax=Acinetobacter pittii TaxID=48296 RepID=A0AB33BA91_ACIPI|nr:MULTISPECIES: hypothetical protein [Acinetobacter calcoaceticus/baumannii complex]AMX18686.1 hypothetical protein IEC338SC_1546 [Acinetobacter pittii]SEO74977.1 hypothetical protein SAMN02799632_01238 [Acinetobacter pittii]
MMDVQSQLLFYWEFCQTLIEIMVAERKGVRRLETKEPAHPKVSPFRPTVEKKGANEFPTHKTKVLHIDFVFPVCDNRLAMWPAGKG